MTQSVSVMETILDGMSNVTPEQIAKGSLVASNRDPSVQTTCFADDYLKRLWIFNERNFIELQGVGSENQRLMRAIFGASEVVNVHDLGSWVVGLTDGSKHQLALQVQENCEKMKQIQPMLDVGKELFRAETVRRFPELGALDILEVYSDWSIVGRPRRRSSAFDAREHTERTLREDHGGGDDHSGDHGPHRESAHTHP
jgi:hypothetical protein